MSTTYWTCRYCNSSNINLNKGGRFDDYPDKCDTCYWKDKALFAEQQLFQIRTILFGEENPEAPDIQSGKLVDEVRYMNRMLGEFKEILSSQQQEQTPKPTYYVAVEIGEDEYFLDKGPYISLLNAMAYPAPNELYVIVQNDKGKINPVVRWNKETGWT